MLARKHLKYKYLHVYTDGRTYKNFIGQAKAIKAIVMCLSMDREAEFAWPRSVYGCNNY